MSRKSLFFLCLAAISVYLLHKISAWGFDWSLFLSSLRNVHPGWLGASIVATILTYVVRSFRWQVLLNPLKSVGIGTLSTTNLLGFSAIYLIGRPGELVRPIWLTRQAGIPLTASVATVIVERVLDTLMLIALFGWSLLVVQLPSAAAPSITLMKNAAWFMVALSVISILFLFFFRSNVDRINRYVPFKRLHTLLKNFSEGLSFLDQRRSFALALIHSAVVWTVIVLQFWFMLLGMDFHFSVSAATLIMVGAAIGSVAQLPAIGGGFQALCYFFMTTFFSVPPEQAAASALIAWISQSVPTVLLGSVYMISHGLSLKDLRTATAD